MVKQKQAEELVKVTHYVTTEQVIAMERIRAKRLEAGKRLGQVDKSSLMREALDLLIRKEKVREKVGV